MTGLILFYQKEDSVRLQCEIDINKLFSTSKERERFENKWNNFLESDHYNKKLFELKGNILKYQSEQLIPRKVNETSPLLLILGNPASHSIKEGMFFSFEKDKKEHRFWRDILTKSGVLELSFDSNLPVTELNERRKNQLLNLDYNSPFRIGLCVFISMPSKASGPWSGIAGVQKLIGAKAMKKLEKEESKRIIECAQKFLEPKGVAVAFQKNAWNALRSDKAPEYTLDKAKNGKLKGRLKEMPNIPLFGVPPTRLSAPCSGILRQLLKEQGYSLKYNKS